MRSNEDPAQPKQKTETKKQREIETACVHKSTCVHGEWGMGNLQSQDSREEKKLQQNQ